MSTKCTIGHGPQHHLYAECFEQDNVHLQLDRPEYEVCRYGGDDSLRVAIPVKTWRAIVQAWVESPWGQDPSQDNAKEEFDIATLECLEAQGRVMDTPSRPPGWTCPGIDAALQTSRRIRWRIHTGKKLEDLEKLCRLLETQLENVREENKALRAWACRRATPAAS